MYLLGRIKVTTELPNEIKRLKDIAYNLWWSWNHEAIELFSTIDMDLWDKTNKNPVHFLQEVNQDKLYEKISDPNFMDKYNSVVAKFDNYMTKKIHGILVITQINYLRI